MASALVRRRTAFPGRTLARLGLAVVVPLAGLVLWAATARYGWLPPQILPAPDIVLGTFADMLRSGELLDHTRISLLRVALGFGLGAGAGLLLGTAMGLWPTFEDYVRPLFTVIDGGRRD